MKRLLVMGAALALTAMMATAETQTWTLTNNVAISYVSELFRLPVKFTAPYDADKLVVMEDGVPTPTQIEVLDGTRDAVKSANIWVCTTVATGGQHTYVAITDGTPAAATPLVKITQNDTSITLNNGTIMLKLPASVPDETIIPGPVMGIRPATSKLMLGGSSWSTSLRLKEFTATVTGDGTLFARVKLHYSFEATGNIADPYADFIIRLAPGQQAATVEEAHQMAAGDYWTFAASAGWAPSSSLVRGWSRWDTTVPPAPDYSKITDKMRAYTKPGGPNATGPKTDESVRCLPFLPSARTGTTLLSLQPRWTDNVDAGWFAYVSDSNPQDPADAPATPGVKALPYTTPAKVLGMVAARAGKWDWPYDNMPQLRLTDDGNGAEFACPTTRGRRFTLLAVGGSSLVVKATDLVNLMSVAPLDKMVSDYNLEGKWAAGESFMPFSPFTNRDANPTGLLNIRADGMYRALTAQTIPPLTLAALGEYQSMLDADYYSGYNNHWSPVQTNFSMNIVRFMALRAVALKDLPNYKDICTQVEKTLRAEAANTITMPGGAMQTSPGLAFATLTKWDELADVCRIYLNFDPHKWPQLQAAATNLQHLTVPSYMGRTLLATGDTDSLITAAQLQTLGNKFGVAATVAQLKSEELPGYGVIFHDQYGSATESFLAFKAGPNRAKMHGDQLSFHYATQNRGVLVDHFSGSNPRAEQEHMHNRVSFTPDNPTWKYANMDGYERLIAFKNGTLGDVAVGQVESNRLRSEPQYPNEIVTQEKAAIYPLEAPLVYRRTMVMVKPGATPGGVAYFVIRDQATGPMVKETLHFHTAITKITSFMQGRNSPVIADSLTDPTISFVVSSTQPIEMNPLKWWHADKSVAGLFEDTVDPGITTPATTSYDMISAFVALPGAKNPSLAPFPGGVTVTMPNGQSDQITFIDPAGDAAPDFALIKLTRAGKEETLLTVGDVDLNRSQGKTGLFVPEAGYDLGPIPDWLLTQRPSTVVDRTWEK